MKGIKVKFVSTSEDGQTGLLTISKENEEYVFGPIKESLVGLPERIEGHKEKYEANLKEEKDKEAAAEIVKTTAEKTQKTLKDVKTKTKPPAGDGSDSPGLPAKMNPPAPVEAAAKVPDNQLNLLAI
jgi:hypothetical protein